MRWPLLLLALAACSPAPAAQKPAAEPGTRVRVYPNKPAPGWDLLSGVASVEAYWPSEARPQLAVTCEGRRGLIRIAFLTDPGDQVIAAETLTVTSGSNSLVGPLTFRSAEDMTAEDPPAFAEFAPTPQLEAVLTSGHPIRFARSRHATVQTPGDNGFLRQVVMSCRS